VIFTDRAEAGRLLANELRDYRGKDVVVFALPRGGIPVAREIAHALHAPMDLLVVRKLGVPSQPELAMGAIMDGDPPIVVRNDNVIRLAWVSGEVFNQTCERELTEVRRRRRRYLGDKPPVDVAGRNAIIVDDGIATGSTVKAALLGLRKRSPSKIVIAVPVAAPDSIAALSSLADDVVCLEMPEGFGAIGNFYTHFRQLSDDEAVALLGDVEPAFAELGTGSN